MSIKISANLLRQLLYEIENTARITHGRYDRRTGTYPWNDKIWKEADPHRFKLVQRAKRLLKP